jgi:hypothetical protein
MSSNASGRRRGQASRYLNGGENALMRGPSQPGDEQNGTWTREQLERMDAKFCAAMERAIASGAGTHAGAGRGGARSLARLVRYPLPGFARCGIMNERGKPFSAASIVSML